MMTSWAERRSHRSPLTATCARPFTGHRLLVVVDLTTVDVHTY